MSAPLLVGSALGLWWFSQRGSPSKKSDHELASEEKNKDRIPKGKENEKRYQAKRIHVVNPFDRNDMAQFSDHAFKTGVINGRMQAINNQLQPDHRYIEMMNEQSTYHDDELHPWRREKLANFQALTRKDHKLINPVYHRPDMVSSTMTWL